MKVIGLTGGIGSGKSTVARFLAGLGAVVIEADKLGHEALKPGTRVWQDVIAAFGREILTPEDEIDRSKLAAKVFADSGALERLNRIIQPRIREMIEARLEQYRQQGVEVVVLDAPLLFEVGDADLVDEIWVTVASEETVLRRLRERSGLSEQESLARIRSQMSNEERVKRADVVIDNGCSLDELKDMVSKLWQGLGDIASP